MPANLELTGYDELLKQLDRIDSALTGKLKRDCVKAAAEIVAARARALAPVGDPAHDPGAKPLRDTIAIEIRDYGLRSLAVIGPAVPAGAHGHLVEYGHEIVTGRRARGKRANRTKDTRQRTGGRTRPRPFLRPAMDETQAEQLAAMEAVAEATIRDLGL